MSHAGPTLARIIGELMTELTNSTLDLLKCTISYDCASTFHPRQIVLVLWKKIF